MALTPVKTLAVLVALAPLGLMSINGASASGYVSSPTARAQLCKTGENINCGDFAKFQSELIQSETTESGFPRLLLASAGLERYQALDTESATQWHKNPITQGKLDISWQITSPSNISNWKYYMTKPDWQQTLDKQKRLTAASFEATPFCEIANDATQVQQGVISHQCQLPVRDGYQLIYAVANLADKQEGKASSIYNVIDVDFESSNVQVTASINGEWTKQIATIDRLVVDSPVVVKAGDVVRARFFAENSGEIINKEVEVTMLPGEESSWSYYMAQAINSKHSDVRAGVLHANGEVYPEKHSINSVYAHSDSRLNHAEFTIN